MTIKYGVTGNLIDQRVNWFAFQLTFGIFATQLTFGLGMRFWWVNHKQTFRHEYKAMLRGVLAAGRPTGVCTVYDAVPGLVSEAVTLLSLFNDVIVREAARERLPVLDLRLVCDEPRDYSAVSPIEPSQHGGNKIATAVAYAVASHDFGRRESVVYGKS